MSSPPDTSSPLAAQPDLAGAAAASPPLAAPAAHSASLQILRTLLRALSQVGVDALVFTTGEPAQVERGDKRAPLTQKPLSSEQIEAILAPTHLFAALDAKAGSQVKHAFTQEEVRYQATALRGPSGLRIRLVRGEEVAVDRPLGAGPPPLAASAPGATPSSMAKAVPLPTASAVAAQALAKPHETPVEAAPARPQVLRSRNTVNVPAPSARGAAALPAVALAPVVAPAAAAAAAADPRPVATGVVPPALAAQPAAVVVDGPCVQALAAARQQGASDVHFVDNERPRWRRAGALVPEGEALPPGALADFAFRVLPAGLQGRFAQEAYADFACEVVGAGRLRANLSRQTGGLKLCLRLVAAAPRSFAELGLPPQVAAVSNYHQGLAVIAGPQGHGKSTTLTAILDRINAERTSHVVLVEDPIEVIHPRQRALFSQREVGSHTRSFARALKASLREDPDIIVIGELRDRETIEMALSAAETGHLVLTTMNTRSAAKTIDRLIDLFPPDDQPQVRAALAGALKMIVSQRLLPATAGGQVPAVEVVTGSPPLWALIRDNKLVQLPTLQQRGASLGMMLLDQSLADLVHAKKVTLADALQVSEQPAELQRRVAALAAGTGSAS